MFDISGTMWLVTIGFVYGLKSIWLPWLWPTFNQIFLMVFLSAWLRRSNVTTGAQWIETRFGTGTGARLSHTVVVIFALIGGLGFLAYGFVGLGKFVEIFLPWEIVQPYLGITIAPEFVPHLYGIVFTLVAVGYTILGGMRSIVLADVLQFTIMTISAVVVAVIAMTALAHTPLVVPDGWMSPWFGWELDLDWTGIITEVNQKISGDQFGLFTIFFMMMVFKGILVSAAGPAPNYDMQKILATRSPREASLMSGFVSLVLSPSRYLMITGFVVLGLLFYNQLDLISGGQLDFEQILPSAINEFVPAGFTGLLLAGPCRGLRLDVFGNAQRGPGLRRQRPLPQVHRPQGVAETHGHRQLRQRPAHRRGQHRPRFLRQERQQHAAVDRVGAVGRLPLLQRPQVVLVALQRPRLLLGHGCGHRAGSDRPHDLARRAAALLLPPPHGDFAASVASSVPT